MTNDYLSLPLVMLGNHAHNPHDALATNDFALFTALFDRWFNFHDDSLLVHLYKPNTISEKMRVLLT